MRKPALHRGWVAFVLLLAIIICDIPSMVYAKTTQEQLEDAKNEKTRLENIIDKNEDLLQGLKETESELQAELRVLNEKLTAVCETLADLEGQISAKEIEISETEIELAAAKEKEAWQYECMVQRIQYMYEQGGMNLIDVLLSAGSFSELLAYGSYFMAIAEYDENMMNEYEATRVQIEEHEAFLKQEKKDLDLLYVLAEVEKSKVAGLISQTAASVADYEDQIADAEALADKYEALLKAQESDIKKLQKQIEKEKELSQAAANSTWRDISEITFADGDRKLLANIIYCEAGGEPYEGQVAVGAVVINRVLSSKYPNTVVGVVYQPYQFAPVRSGKLALALSVDKATASCYKAADAAMSGITNVGNCLYFRTPIPGLTGMKIGGHIFY